MRPPGSILETVLYAEDLQAARRFYAGLLGLTPMSEPGDLSAGFRIGPGQVLLIFDPRQSGQPGRAVPSHGASGPGHVALRIPPEDFGEWQARLTETGVEIEQVVAWDRRRGRSIYLRDPAGNSVELIDADIWPHG